MDLIMIMVDSQWCRFTPETYKHPWGWPEYISWEELNNPLKGYVKNNNSIFKTATVKVKKLVTNQIEPDSCVCKRKLQENEDDDDHPKKRKMEEWKRLLDQN